MTFRRVATVRILPDLLLICLLIGGFPTASTAGRPPSQRSLADRLRYGPGLANHPVGVTPSPAVTVPEGWPLGLNGAITCLTCHESLPDLDGGAKTYLRDSDDELASPNQFCTKCHSASDRRSAAGLHWMAAGVAHVMPRSSSSARSGGVIDSQSLACLGCHDGVTATEPANRVGLSGAAVSFEDQQRNHPIGITYLDRTRRSSNSRLRPASLLPEQIRLPNGQVSCVSCHDLYAKQQALLTVPIEGSALCFTCHAMD